jgi:uncharacterized protein
MSEEKKSSCCGGGKQKMVLIIIGLVLLTAIILAAILRDRLVNQQFKSVTVNGQGRVSYQPDLAIVNLGVQIDKVAKPDDALSQLNGKVTAIIKAVKEVGLTEADIQTQNYSLYPQYDYKDNISTVSGYNANEQLVIKVNNYNQDSDKLSRVIAAASRAGANQVNSLIFDASNLNDLKQEARLKAITDAGSKSQALADAAGVKLGEITGWYENMVSSAPYVTDGKGGQGRESNSPQVPAGEQEIVIEMGVTYSLK